jgi:glucose/arabinose dehydrogenase
MPPPRLPGVVPAAWTRLATVLLTLAAACNPPEPTPVERNRAVLLIGNTRGDNVIIVDEQTGELLGDFIPAGRGNLKAPDALVFGPDGHLYVTSGDTRANSAVLRFHGKTGEFLGTFSSGNGLFRPYGLAFGPDNYLYVSSFLSDQILRFSRQTGTFVDVFAQGNGQPGGLNGPNALAFGPDGALYVSTQGSVAVDGQPTFPGLPRQVLRFNLISR